MDSRSVEVAQQAVPLDAVLPGGAVGPRLATHEALRQRSEIAALATGVEITTFARTIEGSRFSGTSERAVLRVTAEVVLLDLPNDRADQDRVCEQALLLVGAQLSILPRASQVARLVVARELMLLDVTDDDAFGVAPACICAGAGYDEMLVAGTPGCLQLRL